MANRVKRRRCGRFEIPGAEAKYKKTGLLALFNGYSDPCHVINVSKGGLAFACDKKLSNGKKLAVQLLTPHASLLNLNAIVNSPTILNR